MLLCIAWDGMGYPNLQSQRDTFYSDKIKIFGKILKTQNTRKVRVTILRQRSINTETHYND